VVRVFRVFRGSLDGGAVLFVWFVWFVWSVVRSWGGAAAGVRQWPSFCRRGAGACRVEAEGVRMRVVLGDGRSRLILIPPGVAHGCRNLASARGRVIYFTDTHFSPAPESCDEGRLPWDFAGFDIWEVARE